ncbi:MAG: biopolymer transporter ExbD [Candidatus Zhuqueibacterota bacterium]
MVKGGLIIRLIDVVLIVLFSFLNITDIDRKGQIKLPSIGPSKSQKVAQQLLFLTIENGNTFVLTDGQQAIAQLDSLPKLERMIANLNDQYKLEQRRMVLVIEPAMESIIQSTIDVMDICEKYNIPKSVSYSKIELN